MIPSFPSYLPPFLALATLTSLTHAFKFLSTGATVELNGIPYYVPPASIGKLGIDQSLSNAAVSIGGLLPLTVIKTNGTSYQSSDLHNTVNSFLANDDVFQTGFLDGKISENIFDWPYERPRNILLIQL